MQAVEAPSFSSKLIDLVWRSTSRSARGLFHRQVGRCGRWTGLLSRCPRERPWAWWGSRGAERPPWAGPCSAWWSRPGARCATRGGIWSRSPAERCGPLRREMQIIFQDPYSSLNPRMTVGHIVGEPLASRARTSPGAPADDRVGELLDLVGLDRRPSTATPTSSPAASASGSALPGPSPSSPKLIVCDEPVSRPRRVDPGPGRQPPAGPPGRVRPDLHLHRPRPLGRCATSPTAWR